MQDPNAPTAMQSFQLSYGKYLRDPSRSSLPKGVPPRRSEIYESLFFSNVCGFIDKCFPVANSFFSDDEWRGLCRDFFRDWRSETPIFSQIPFEFVRFISETDARQDLPPWLPELLHYEWVELEVDLAEESVIDMKPLQTNPTLRLLAYQWPVHCIRVDAPPETQQETFLAVYRDPALNVTFLEINALTFMLLQYIEETSDETASVLAGFAEHIQHPNPQELTVFAAQLINNLIEQHILIGVYSEQGN